MLCVASRIRWFLIHIDAARNSNSLYSGSGIQKTYIPICFFPYEIPTVSILMEILCIEILLYIHLRNLNEKKTFSIICFFFFVLFVLQYT